MKFDKQLKDFLNNFQKDLNVLQKALKKESDDLLKKVKTAAAKDNIQAKRKEIEQLLEKNLKKYEPTINRFVKDIHNSAKKAGVDLTELETKVRSTLSNAGTKLSQSGGGVKGAKKGAGSAKKPAAAKKAAAKRGGSKKTSVAPATGDGAMHGDHPEE